jgi:hypothetical protein
MIQVYCLLVTRRFGFTMGAYISMFVIGCIVSGFTTYIRYVYPIVVILPILVIRNQGRSSWALSLNNMLSFVRQPKMGKIPSEVVTYGSK